MNPYIKILRPSVCILSIIVLLAGAIVAGTLLNPMLIIAAIVVFAVTGAGNVINDYFDYKIDKINAPNRIIPSGKITRSAALKFYWSLSIIGLVFSMFLGAAFFVLALVNIIIAGTYARYFKKTALLGNAMVSWLAASIFLAAGLVSLSGAIAPSILILFLISFLGTMCREIIKDIEDMKGDKKSGARTLPLLIGEARGRFVAAVFLLLAVVSLLLPVFFNILSILYVPFAVLGALMTIAALFMNAHKAQKIIKIAMYVITLGFIVGSVL